MAPRCIWRYINDAQNIINPLYLASTVRLELNHGMPHLALS